MYQKKMNPRCGFFHFNYLCVVFITLALSISGCSKNSSSESTLDLDIQIEVLETIELYSQNAYPNLFKVFNVNKDSIAIQGIDRRSNKILYFNQGGKVIAELNIPTINEPTGINRISDAYFFNKDSIFIYDAQFLRLLLMNHRNEIVDFWRLKTIWKQGIGSANVDIVDVEKSMNGNTVIEITGFEENYHLTSPDFYSQSNLVHKIDLDSKLVSSNLNYPEESPYREYFFRQAISPSVVKYQDHYFVTFPMDKNIYLFDKKLDTYDVFDNSALNFPKAIGEKFGSQQTSNRALYTRKLNGFGLDIKEPIYIEGVGDCLLRVYREALGADDNIPDDMASFLSMNFPTTFNLEIYQVKNAKLTKIAFKRSINTLSLGNFIGQNIDGTLYFLEYNNEVENPRLLKVRISLMH